MLVDLPLHFCLVLCFLLLKLVDDLRQAVVIELQPFHLGVQIVYFAITLVQLPHIKSSIRLEIWNDHSQSLDLLVNCVELLIQRIFLFEKPIEKHRELDRGVLAKVKLRRYLLSQVLILFRTLFPSADHSEYLGRFVLYESGIERFAPYLPPNRL